MDYLNIKLPIEKLKLLDIGLVYIFGSKAEGLAGKLSDIDIGVVFVNPKIVKGDTRKIYNELYEIFSNVFQSANIDVVLMERASLELRFDVISHGKILFAISPDFRFDFESRINLLYMDFKPLLKNFDKAVLERI